MLLASHSHPQHEVDNDGGEEGNGQDGGTQPVVEAALASHPYAPRAPMKGKQGIDHGHHGNEGEETSRNLADLVAKVK